LIKDTDFSLTNACSMNGLSESGAALPSQAVQLAVGVSYQVMPGWCSRLWQKNH
jgi:hypothetical protein